jgi:hypothetical protein
LSPKCTTGSSSTVSIAANIFASLGNTRASKPNARSARAPLSSHPSSRSRSRHQIPVPRRSRLFVRCAMRCYIPLKTRKAKRLPAPNAIATSKPNPPQSMPHSASSVS